MADQDSASGVDLYQIAHIVSSYVRHHQVPSDQLGTLIVAVYRALGGLGLGPADTSRAAAASGADPPLGAGGLCGLS
jgi:predicted transcriptional regulator